MKKLQEKAFILLFAYFAIFQTLTSTWAVRALHISAGVSRVFTLLVYLPFVLAVGYKLFTDIRRIKVTFSSVSNWIYYAFLLYYLGLCIYRLIAHMEVKENLYFSIIFFGAVAIYMLLRSGRIFMSKKDLQKNLLWISAFFILYRLAYVLVGVNIFAKQPINLNLTTGTVAMLLPFVCNMLTEPGLDKRKSWLPWVVLCGSIVVIATSGSRAIFALTVATFGIMLVVTLIRRKGLLRLVTAFLLGVAIVVGLALGNVGKVRYSLYRQTGVDLTATYELFDSAMPTQSQNTTDATKETDETKDPMDTEATQKPSSTDKEPITETPPVEQQQAQNQIDKSDKMRRNLVEHGIELMMKNPLFGCGDVLYGYRISRNYKTMQSAHNFLLEAMVCYGAIGLVMIAALFVTLLIEAKLFTRSALRRWNYKITLLLTMVFYFGLGFVQPIVFDVFMCPLFVLIMAACRKGLQDTQ